MTELYLQKDGGMMTRVYFDGSGTGFKLTRENPYFTQAESYTLDVILPMDIIENRSFFQNLQRMERTKQPETMKSLLVVSGRPVISGTARVTQVTDLAVKVQLSGGSSDANLKGRKLYIDEMDMGQCTASAIQPEGYDNYNDAGVRFVFMQAYDETAGEVVNRKVATMTATKDGTTRTPLTSYMEGDAPQPALLDVLARVIEAMGYTPGEMFPWQEPWKDLYVASAKKTRQLAHALPHWTAKEFIDEVCSFFNCTMKVDHVAQTISLLSNVSFYGSPQTTVIEPVDEYTADVQDNEEGARSLADENIVYGMSSSPAHDYDCLTEALRDNAPRLSYDSMNALQEAWSTLGTARRKYILECPAGKYVDWKDSEESESRLVRVDMFAPLKRDRTSDRELKIVPVAITEDVCGTYIENVNDNVGIYKIAFRSLSLENPTGHELGTADDGTMADIQDLITGEEETESQAEKEDRLQLFFLEDVDQPAVATLNYTDEDPEYRTFQARMPMTDWQYKVHGSGHRQWSLALSNSNATFHLGQLHQNGFSFNMRARHTFRFIADAMPDPRNVFIIRGKHYGCEKIECGVDTEGFSRIMTGYFYEML